METIIAVAAAFIAGNSAAMAATAPVCPPTTVFTPALEHLDGYRVFIGSDGDSAVEPYRIDAKQVPMLKTGKILKLLMLPKPGEHVPEIVVGPPNVDVDFHPAPYKEVFILLGGSFTFKTAKESHAMAPGSVLFFDDVGAKVGHGGVIGPCGYVSLSVAPEK